MRSEDEVKQRIKEWKVDMVRVDRDKTGNPDFKRGLKYAATMVIEELKWVVDE